MNLRNQDFERGKLLSEMEELTEKIADRAERLGLQNLQNYVEMANLEALASQHEGERHTQLFGDPLSSRTTANRYIELLGIMERDFDRIGDEIIVYFLQMLTGALADQYPSLSRREQAKISQMEQNLRNSFLRHGEGAMTTPL